MAKMKKRWADRKFICECRASVATGDVCYICVCCNRRLCKQCGPDGKLIIEDTTDVYFDFIRINTHEGWQHPENFTVTGGG